MKIYNFLIIFIIYTISISFCATTSTTTTTEITLTPGPLTCEYSKKDSNEDYDASSDINIKCTSSGCTVTNGEVAVSDGLVSITTAGTYIIEGTLNGQINVTADKSEFVHLVLNGVTIKSSNGPAIYVVSSDKVTITLVGENVLTDSTNYTVENDEPDACLFVNSDFAINGSGSLTVTGNYGDAIRCKKDLRIVSGNITVPGAVQKGIKVKNSLCIKDGTIDVTSTDSSIKVTRDDDPEKGYIVIDGGNIALSTGNDGIHAETHLTINNGYINIRKSNEGIEGQMIDILGGEIHVMASDDGINASKISSSSDDSTSTNKNMGPGNESSTGTDGSVYINITGGKTFVTVSGNDVDGIDSNGVLYIGGSAEVYASISGGNIYGNMAVLDAEGSNDINSGATVIATAGSMGRFKRQGGGGGQKHGGPGNFDGMGGMGESGSIYQPYVQTTVTSQNAGTEITVKDSNDKVIASYTPNASYSTVLVTTPSMKEGETYKIVTGSSTVSVSASAASTGEAKSPSLNSESDDNNNNNKKESTPSNGTKIQIKFISFLFIIFITIAFIY